MSALWPASHFTQATQSRWGRALLTLGAVWSALLLLFRADVADLAGIYWNSTTYGHCLFVAPVVGWLVWQRRADVSTLVPQGWWPGLGIVAAGAGGWFLGEIAGVAFARHLGLVMMLQGAVVAVLGHQVARGLLFPLAYMAFLVPFGEWLEAPLQDVTVVMTIWGLALVGVPAVVDGVLITTPTGYFEVAEACSGAKFVIAMIAYATLVANVCYVSWARRAAFFAMAMVVPVIANGLRAFGTIWAAHLTSVEAATGADHIVFGWVFFAVVMAAVLAIGWRWFDRDPDAAWFDPAALPPVAQQRIGRRIASAATIGIAALALLAGTAVAGRADTLPDQLRLPDVPGWTRAPLSAAAPWAPHYPTADHQLFGRYVDAQGRAVDLGVAVYAGQREGHELVAFGQGVLRENDRWVRVTDEAPLDSGSVMRITAPGPVERLVATWYVLRGQATASERQVKVQTMTAKLLGGEQRGVAIHLSAETARGDARGDIARFLSAAGPVDRLAQTITTGH